MLQFRNCELFYVELLRLPIRIIIIRYAIRNLIDLITYQTLIITYMYTSYMQPKLSPGGTFSPRVDFFRAYALKFGKKPKSPEKMGILSYIWLK